MTNLNSVKSEVFRLFDGGWVVDDDGSKDMEEIGEGVTGMRGVTRIGGSNTPVEE